MLGGRCQNLGTWQDGREEDDNAGARCGREQLDTSLVGFLNLDIGTVVNTEYTIFGETCLILVN